MPAIFSNTFSQTYVDLLKNINPYEKRSDGSESEVHPKKGGKPSNLTKTDLKIKKRTSPDSPIKTKTEDTNSPEKNRDTQAIFSSVGSTSHDEEMGKTTLEKRIENNPELQFYKKVL